MLSEQLQSNEGRKPGANEERLSESLAAMLRESDVSNLTLNDLIERTSHRGVYLLLLLLSLPFITPIPLPGLSTILGVSIAMLAVRLAFRLPPRLPRFLGTRQISRKRMRTFVRSSATVLRILEKLSKPRWSDWLQVPAVRFGNALLLVFMGLLLALPLPPVLPFSNSLPSWAIIIIALAVMESDGVLIWVGYVVALGTLIYLTFFTSLVAAGFHRLFHLFWPGA